MRRCKELGFSIDADASILTPSSVFFSPTFFHPYFAEHIHIRTANFCSSDVNGPLGCKETARRVRM